MDRLIGWIVKLFVLLMLGPFLVCLLLQLVASLAAIFLPWYLAPAILGGVAAGLAKGLVLRRHLPPRDDAPLLTPGTPSLAPHRVRRPRGRRTW